MNVQRASTRLCLATLMYAFVASCNGCFGCQTSPVDQTNDFILPRSCEAEVPNIEAQRLDILFVIDNSGSMAEEQAAVARELTGFINAIRNGGGVRQDFNVGVITTSIYQRAKAGAVTTSRDYPAESGRLRPVPIALVDGGLDLESGSERVLSGDDPMLLEKFSRLVQQGILGSAQEAPFEAVRLALLAPELATKPLAQGGNQGFLRDGARLLVVMLTDEDDCSERTRPPNVVLGTDQSVNECSKNSNLLTPVNEYHQLFSTGLVNADQTPKEIIWAAIAPVSRETRAAQEIIDNGQVRNIDCPTSNQAGTRHRAMAEAFDTTLSNLDSICRESFRETLIHIAELAAVSQSLELSGVSSIKAVQIQITRKDGVIVRCTERNEGVTLIDAGGVGKPLKLRFQNQCQRRADDVKVDVQLLCAG